MTNITYSIYHLEHPPAEGSADRISISDREYPFTILVNHAPAIAALTTGKIRIYNHDKIIEEIVYSDGFLQINDNRCVINILR